MTACKAKDAEIALLRQKITTYEGELKRQTLKQIDQNQVIEKTLTQRNTVMNDVLEENQKLREEVKRLKSRD